MILDFCDGVGSGIVCLAGSGGLGVPKFCKGGSDHCCILGVAKEGAGFGFGCRGYNMADDAKVGVDSAIENRGFLFGRMSGKEKEATGSTPGFGSI